MFNKKLKAELACQQKRAEALCEKVWRDIDTIKELECQVNIEKRRKNMHREALIAMGVEGKDRALEIAISIAYAETPNGDRSYKAQKNNIIVGDLKDTRRALVEELAAHREIMREGLIAVAAKKEAETQKRVDEDAAYLDNDALDAEARLQAMVKETVVGVVTEMITVGNKLNKLNAADSSNDLSPAAFAQMVPKL